MCGFETTAHWVKSTLRQIKNGLSPNQLLSTLIGQVEINGFTENIPTMNDIFIELVKEVNNE